jgi:hypothetical protein
LRLPRRDFEIYRRGRMVVVPGKYQIWVGQSSQRLPLEVTVTAP